MAYSAPDPADGRTAAEPDATEPDLTTNPVPPEPAATEHPRNPLLAALGAGDAAVAAVARAFADAVETASARQKTVQQRVADLPAELEHLRERFSSEELRRALEAYRAQVERAYAEFAGRGEEAWGRLREQPQVRRFAGRAADTVIDASAATADAVEDAGAATAGAIEDAGEKTATATGKSTRSATPRRAPRGPASG